jgi:signal transduction histidine kinase/CheY-like chemotaxis protein
MMGIETISHLSSDIEDDFKKLRNETVLFTNGLMMIFGVIILAGVPWYPQPTWAVLTAFGLFGLAALLWPQRQNFILSATLQILGFLAAMGIVLVFGQITAVLFLIPLLVGITLIMFDILPGSLLAVIISLVVIFLPPAFVPQTAYIKPILLIAIWGMFGIVWLVLRPLLIAIERAWNGYERSLDLLKQSQDLQIKLFETLEDLSKANEQLTRLNQVAHSLRQIAEQERQAKEQFVANVSHELRTPLNMIIGFCENILQAPESYDEPIPQTLMADMEVVLRNGLQLSNLIDDVLDLSQVDAGQVALSKERSSLEELIEEAVIAVRPLYQSKNLSITMDIPADLPAITCDRTRIREVILNLLSNAGRFTEKGGVWVKARQVDKNLIVSVKDTGPGIARHDQELIFKPFKQLELGMQRRHGGTGLGLSISKSFVELHNGKMWIESEPGQGATFLFRLPIEELEAMDTENVTRWFNPYHPYEKRERPIQFKPSRVLPRLVVVEPGNVLQKLLKRYLSGFEINAFPDLETAVSDLELVPAQALLVNDLHLERSISDLHRRELPYNIPAICCFIPGVEEASRSFGVRDYLIKPISRQAIFEALEKLETPVKNILIVDDDTDALQLFRRILVTSGKGYQVFRAMNGRQGLEILRKEAIDVILLDLVMPEMNGFEFLEEKSRDQLLSSLPVILISARDPQGHPIASDVVAVTRSAGLSTPNIMACIEAFISILTPHGPPVDSKAPDTASG